MDANMEEMITEAPGASAVPVPKAGDVSIIAQGLKVMGSIYSEGSVDILGLVEGDVEIVGKLSVTGTVNGKVVAHEMYCEGATVKGDVICEGAAKVGADSVIIGNITATSAAIAGAVNGDIDVNGPVVLDSTAIIMGNIKSKLVQINNGAIVEGMCSQCYGDVTPAAFFDQYINKTE